MQNDPVQRAVNLSPEAHLEALHYHPPTHSGNVSIVFVGHIVLDNLYDIPRGVHGFSVNPGTVIQRGNVVCRKPTRYLALYRGEIALYRGEIALYRGEIAVWRIYQLLPFLLSRDITRVME